MTPTTPTTPGHTTLVRRYDPYDPGSYDTLYDPPTTRYVVAHGHAEACDPVLSCCKQACAPSSTSNEQAHSEPPDARVAER